MRVIAELFQSDSKKLVPFITAGYPELEITPDLVLAAERAGADMVEIGMPFSDPLADGPVIQEASQVAITSGVTVKRILGMVEQIRRQSEIPIVLMGYINPIFKYGTDQFLQDAASAGVNGLIIPDVPLEEGDELFAQIKSANLSPILLVAPNTADKRIATLGFTAEDLLYAVSILGVTGSGLKNHEKLHSYFNRIRKNTSTPFVVGFGISSPEDIRSIGDIPDGVVVGSALLNKIAASDKPVKATEEFLGSLRGALDEVGEGVSMESRSSTGSE